ncbi:TPA: DNA-binding transcriptional repressor [Pasteurella multocida]|uniref:HTH deoR-type domain-containing protein n=2 Tax=Pasteurella multocida TaxID=747 RepID=Q9CJN3_PASMU|nr:MULTISPECIES: DNA-binding transcriptional repressor [Pasteurella]AWW60188.1 HTH domain-containing protein [Pasteurellaceae bacterium 12591]EGP03153.1 DNA-bindng transcriptional repressor SrlR [Pasteurella multocida subsp. multocida str. Anand1_goat]AAK04048.1 unknown [Pasteurella multocida subsp. multocida str. Pm70]AET16266.1 glucitol operon repressor [Pasteurella multocida 36950]AFF24593.1 DNA-bindng transcriptional repressor SrlR [Pasteurella multocida subsp. multocida str. HN06]
MKPFERQQHIFNYLMTNGKTKVDELASHFHLTGATIRKDLTALEKQNKVLRTYGSVVVTQKDLEQDPPIDFKTNVNLSQKQRIGKKAATLINEGDSIIFDAGSTVLQIIPNLTTFDNLSIMTNSLTIFNAVLQLNKSYNLLMSGGSFREKSASFHGYFAESVFIGSTFDTLFIGTDGLDLDVGLTTFNEVYRVSSLMCNAAKKIIVLADSSKFGRKTPNIVCGLEKIHTIVTDDKLPTEMKDKLIEKGIEVLIV